MAWVVHRGTVALSATSLGQVALADQFDGLLVDLDGVVWLGPEFLPGSLQALATLLEARKEIVFVTNNPARSGASYAERLRDAGLRSLMSGS